MDKGAVDILHRIGHVTNCVAIDTQGRSFIALSLVNVGVGGAIYYKPYIVIFYECGDAVPVGDVEFFYIGEEPCVAGFRGKKLEVPPQLSVGACQQDIHALVNGVLKLLKLG